MSERRKARQLQLSRDRVEYQKSQHVTTAALQWMLGLFIAATVLLFSAGRVGFWGGILALHGVLATQTFGYVLYMSKLRHQTDAVQASLNKTSAEVPPFNAWHRVTNGAIATVILFAFVDGVYIYSRSELLLFSTCVMVGTSECVIGLLLILVSKHSLRVQQRAEREDYSN
jgi:NhaP-type Na+/H+ or K+/H+ antiporter